MVMTFNVMKDPPAVLKTTEDKMHTWCQVVTPNNDASEALTRHLENIFGIRDS
jgi:hypothetical protein